MAKPIDRQVVVITGASSGIGRETALHLARKEAKVVVSARRNVRRSSLAAIWRWGCWRCCWCAGSSGGSFQRLPSSPLKRSQVVAGQTSVVAWPNERTITDTWAAASLSGASKMST